MLEWLMPFFTMFGPQHNIFYFEGNWHTERCVSVNTPSSQALPIGVLKEDQEKKEPVPIDSIVLHSFEWDQNKDVSTNGQCAKVIQYWLDAKVGAHYIVSFESAEDLLKGFEARFPNLKELEATKKFGNSIRDPKKNAIICCVPDTRAAYHAGMSHFGEFGVFDKGRYTLNFSSIGIEMQGNGTFKGDESIENFDQFSEDQINVVADLVKFLCAHHNLDPKNSVVSHAVIAPLRKKDPGPTIFQALADKGIGWCLPQPVFFLPLEITHTVEEAKTLLQTNGYHPPASLVDLSPRNTAESRFACLFPDTQPEVVYSFLDKFALQYAPWAWANEPQGASKLSQESRELVVRALRAHAVL